MTPSEPVIEARGLSKRYGSVRAVDGLDLTVYAGEVFGLLGPNGAGKTTTILMLLGLTEPSGGTARVLGRDPLRHPLEIKRRVGYLPENVGFYADLTARRNLRFVAELNGLAGAAGEAKVAETLAAVGLAEAADRRVAGFSRGMRQRLGLAEVLVKSPEIFLLDEPTLGLDPEGIESMLELVASLAAERGLTVVLSSHLLPLVERVAHRVAILRQGRQAAEGAVAELAGAAGLAPNLPAVYRHYFAAADAGDSAILKPGPTGADGAERQAGTLNKPFAGQKSHFLPGCGQPRHGFAALFKKELADHFGPGRFPLLAALLFMAALVSAHLAGDGVRAWLREGLGVHLEGRTFLLLFSLPGAGLPVFGLLGYLGPLAALLLSFDAVNRERREGTLVKILAQPVYRDEVLLGKYLAGLFTLALLTGALLLLVAGLGLATAGLAPTAGEALRLGLFWLLSVVYLGFWLGLGLLMSVANRTALASALASAAAWIFLAFFVGLLAGGLADRLAPVSDPVRPARAEVAAREALARRLGLASPVNLYIEAAGFALDPARRTPHQGRQRLDPAVADRYTGRFTGPLEVGQTVIQVWPHLAGLIAWAALAFGLAHLIFRRQEVRSGG